MLHKQVEKKVDPRVKRTRQLLQQALVDMMREKSFQSITVQDIAERATVNRVTFYAHFEDKDALLEYTIRELIRQQLRHQIPDGAPYSAENLTRLILTVCEFLAEMGRQCPLPHTQFEPLMEKQIKAELYEVLRGWLIESPVGVVAHRPTAEQAAMVASWSIYGAVVQWSQQERPEPPTEFVSQVLPLILAGLQPVRLPEE